MILLCVRWDLRSALSYRDLEEMMAERGLSVDHTTMYRWMQRYAPELEKRCRPHLKGTTDSWRVDETYVKTKGVSMYLYRTVDAQGDTLEFLILERMHIKKTLYVKSQKRERKKQGECRYICLPCGKGSLPHRSRPRRARPHPTIPSPALP